MPGSDASHHTTVPILGIPVRFETNDAVVFETVRRAFTGWDQLPSRYRSNTDPLRVTLYRNDDHDVTERPRVEYRTPDADRLFFWTGKSFGTADAAHGRAHAHITDDLVRSGDYFQYAVLEALSLMLVTARDRHPVHAATVRGADVTLLLAGKSGSGKSTLAYAVRRSGLAVHGDDVAYVQLTPELRVWTMGRGIHLTPQAARLFSELESVTPVLLPTGKRKVVVPYATSPRGHAAPLAGPVRVCVLNPGCRDVALERVGEAEVERALTHDVDEGFDLRPDAARRVAGRLAQGGGWRLDLSNDPTESVPLVSRMLAETVALHS